jgi:multidrug resistance efflux pump
MSATFTRTVRSLEADGSRRRVVELLFAVLLVAWASWFFLGSVTVYEVTEPRRACLEVKTTAHAVVAPVGGQVKRINFTIGQPVVMGAVLVILDSKDEQQAKEKCITARDAAKKLLREAERKRQAVELEGKVAIEEAEIRRLEYEIEKRIIRAPVSGRVGEVVAKFQVGSVVNIADKLGTIVPDGKTHVVARFAAASIGRIQPGQLGQLRLDGFPWTQYGTIPVTVAAVGNEATDGFIRVELDLRANSASAVPVGHGLQGSVEVAIEQVSPAVLVLRAAGQFLGTQGSSAQALRDRSEP